MIRSFRNQATADVFADRRTDAARRLGLGEAWKVARRKLIYLHNAHDLRDLRRPPANRLESLKGKRKGQHSIRVNDQHRVCSVWEAGGADEVEITDYH